MKKTVIYENQKGFLFKNGKYVKMLSAGTYRHFGSSEVEVFSVDEPIRPKSCTLETLLSDPEVAAATETCTVGEAELALHFVGGVLRSVLAAGKHAFLTHPEGRTFRRVDLSSPEVEESLPRHLFLRIPTAYYTRVDVAAHEKGLLYIDRKLSRVLDAGVYYFWKAATPVEVKHADTRLLQMDVTGQEILTSDKVSLRVNLVCHYRITDYVRATTEIEDVTEQLHVAAQLAIRAYVGRYKLDEILENKEALSAYVLERLEQKSAELFLTVTDADVKDVILPGEIREIMNTVLVAEKRAQASVIARREEVASTRSLLNTARLMEENATLYRLKELEYVERICENVGNLSVHAGGDLLSELRGLLKRQTP